MSLGFVHFSAKWKNWLTKFWYVPRCLMINRYIPCQVCAYKWRICLLLQQRLDFMSRRAIFLQQSRLQGDKVICCRHHPRHYFCHSPPNLYLHFLRCWLCSYDEAKQWRAHDAWRRLSWFWRQHCHRRSRWEHATAATATTILWSTTISSSWCPRYVSSFRPYVERYIKG